MIGDKWWHEYVINIVALMAGCNFGRTFFDLCKCEASMVPILVVNLVLSLALMSYLCHLAEMEMIENVYS